MLFLTALAMGLSESPQIRMLHEDMTLPHVAIPRGVPAGVDWRSKPRPGMRNEPGSWRAFTLWGQIYAAADVIPTEDVRGQVRNAQAWILSKKTGKWSLLQGPSLVTGAAYVEDFAGDKNRPADVAKGPDGIDAILITPGYNFHFWPPQGRVSIEPTDIGGVVVAMQGRIVGKNTKDHEQRLMLSAGADYWAELNSNWDNFKTNADVGIGRFRWLTSKWQWYTMTSLTKAELEKNPPPKFVQAKRR